ncbi:hypothetical protein RFI_19406 [Reticulomyxa filosa]|uniref:C2H2-type domain-containing protein n=1 Tax=Reticulomyxa filosa TaxID=46433 RepID=X6MWR3_RETFI|nr:hypothetical protein RFI_19406 [Reticulomyxa filosa]|eukprot:ETO17897.1 hypothetical protein RFI_19406 [Reticulomyxa filosa]
MASISLGDAFCFSVDCHKCHVHFTDYNEYGDHLKVHYTNNWLHCDYCGKISAHKSNFVSHLASHTNARPFVCKLCNIRTSTRQNLVSHIHKTHESTANKLIEEAHVSVIPRKKRKVSGTPKKHKKRASRQNNIENLDYGPVCNTKKRASLDPKKKKKQELKRSSDFKDSDSCSNLISPPSLAPSFMPQPFSNDCELEIAGCNFNRNFSPFLPTEEGIQTFNVAHGRGGIPTSVDSSQTFDVRMANIINSQVTQPQHISQKIASQEKGKTQNDERLFHSQSVAADSMELLLAGAAWVCLSTFALRYNIIPLLLKDCTFFWIK